MLDLGVEHGTTGRKYNGDSGKKRMNHPEVALISFSGKKKSVGQQSK